MSSICEFQINEAVVSRSFLRLYFFRISVKENKRKNRKSFSQLPLWLISELQSAGARVLRALECELRWLRVADVIYNTK
jgi:hypothetical protein